MDYFLTPNCPLALVRTRFEYDRKHMYQILDSLTQVIAM